MTTVRIQFSDHALLRMFERRVDARDVHDAVDTGEVLETYPEDTPFPSKLLLGWPRGKPLHVVAADNAEGGVTVIITVYEPDPDKWEPPNYQRRRL